MSSSDYLTILLDKVEHLVGGRWSVPEFEAQFYHYFLDEVPEDALSDRENEFISCLQENLDWTDAKVDQQSRGDGWGDHAQYVAWATRALEAFRSGGEVPPRW